VNQDGDEAGSDPPDRTPGPALPPATPVPRPPWLKITAPLAVVGIVAWPILAMLGLLGAVPATAVVNVGIVTAGLAYVSIRRIKYDRAMALGARGFDPSDLPPEESDRD
jgi:hypothetical protein